MTKLTMEQLNRGGRIFDPVTEHDDKEMLLQNGNLLVVISEDKIRAQDIGDQNNLETIFTKTKRKLQQAKNRINNEFDSEMTLGKLDDILEECKVKYHRYCAID
jgi:hypothetical protein